MRRRHALATILGGASAGCGYALVGRGVTTDASVKRIGVPLFKDKTGKPGLDARVTQAVMEELLRRGRFTVVREASNVDALVEGEILSFNVLPVNFSESGGQTQATRYAIALTANVVYRKVGEKEPIWSNEAFSQRDEYDMGDNPASYFDRETQSIERLSAAFARSLVAAMLEAF
jgi:hypothetical protein